VVIRGYILHMYPKGAITFRRWFYVVIRSNPWLYAAVRGYTTCCSPYASAAYHENSGVVFLSMIVVIRLISLLCVVLRGYILQLS